MSLVLWVSIALAFGLMLFVSLQEKMPEELSFLKTKPAPVVPAPGVSVQKYEGWTITQGAGVVELTKALVVQGKNRTPSTKLLELGILCDKGKLDMRLNTRQATTGTSETPVDVDGVGKRLWQKGADRNIFPREPRTTLVALLQRPQVPITLSYVDAGLKTVMLDTKGLSSLVSQLPLNCRP